MPAPFRIRGVAPAAPTGARGPSAPSSVTAPIDSYILRLIKLIPTEVVGAYLVGRELASANNASAGWALACLMFTVVLRSAMTFEKRERQPWWAGVQWGAVIIAAISFSIWMYSLGDHLPYLAWIPSWAASLALLLWTPLVPYIYTGDPAAPPSPNPVGTLAPQPTVEPAAAPDAVLDVPDPVDSNPLPTRPDVPTPRDILGDDDRGGVEHPKMAPYAPIALLHAFIGNETGAQALGTGWFIGPRTVVTAAHVVHGRAFPPKWLAGRVVGWPGYQQSADENFAFTTHRVTVHPQYVQSQDRRFDIAVLTLTEDMPLPSIFKLDAADDPTVADAEIRVAGFPGDKGGLAMYEASGRVVAAEEEHLFHDADAAEGQSGAPIWIPGSEPRVIGVHVDGKEHSQHLGREANLGVRLTREHVSWIWSQM